MPDEINYSDYLKAFQDAISGADETKFQKIITNEESYAFGQLCSILNWDKTTVFSDGEKIFRVVIKKSNNNYNLCIERVNFSAIKSLINKDLFNKTIKYTAINRYMKEPTLKIEYGWYIRNGEDVIKLAKEYPEFVKEKIIIDKKKAEIIVIPPIPSYLPDQSDTTKEFKNLMNNVLGVIQIDSFITYLSIMVYENRTNKKKPLLVVLNNLNFVKMFIDCIYPNKTTEFSGALTSCDYKILYFKLANFAKKRKIIDQYCLSETDLEFRGRYYRNYSYPVFLLAGQANFYQPGLQSICIAENYFGYDDNDVKRIIKENIGVFLAKYVYPRFVRVLKSKDQLKTEFGIDIMEKPYIDMKEHVIPVMEKILKDVTARDYYKPFYGTQLLKFHKICIVPLRDELKERNLPFNEFVMAMNEMGLIKFRSSYRKNIFYHLKNWQVLDNIKQ